MHNLKEKLYIDEGLLERLADISEQKKISVSALLNEIVGNYLDIEEYQGKKNDRRKFKRKKVMIQAMLFEKSEHENSGRYHPTTILDISMGGVKLNIPLERTGKTDIFNAGSEFEVMFSPDETTGPLVLCCFLARMEKKEYGIQLGAQFTETDTNCHEFLQKYLM